MQYQTLLLAALAAFSNAAASRSEVTLDYGVLTADLGLLIESISATGPGSTSAAAFTKAYSAYTKFDVATGDAPPQHPCPPLLLQAPTNNADANTYVKKAEELITGAYKTTLKKGSYNGVELCEASQYLSFVGQYVGAPA